VTAQQWGGKSGGNRDAGLEGRDRTCRLESKTRLSASEMVERGLLPSVRTQTTTLRGGRLPTAQKKGFQVVKNPNQETQSGKGDV